MSIHQSETKLIVNGKPLTVYHASPVGGGPGVLVLPSWWGLKPFFKQVCVRLAEQGYTALAPDYYDGRIGQTIDDTKALQQEVEGDMETFGARIKAAKDHLVSLRAGVPIALMGFSMGTDWALMTAAQEPDIAATVLFYGGYAMDFSPMKSRVLGHYAETDEWVPMAEINKMEQNMKAAGVDVTLHRYLGMAHWFMEDDRPEYAPTAAALAWERTLAFLKQRR